MLKKEYRQEKPFTTIKEQVTHLKNRGLGGTVEQITCFLMKNNYYRISGYLVFFKNNEGNYDNIDIDKLTAICSFDTELSSLLFKYISIFELSMSRNIAYELAKKNRDPFPHKCICCESHMCENIFNIDSLSPNSESRINEMFSIEKIENSSQKELFIKHYQKNYEPSDTLPIWMFIELLSFGDLTIIFEALHVNLQEHICGYYNNINTRIFISWVQSIKELRNRCAHHNRLCNYTISFEPKIPRDWAMPQTNKKLYLTISALKYLIDCIHQGNTMLSEFKTLFDNYSNFKNFIFPENWEENYPWKNLHN